MKLTCNQVILLLDCRRGYRHVAHTGTLQEDLKILQVAGLISEGACHDDFDWEVTPFGRTLSGHVISQTTWHKVPGPAV